jgi:hypothetical protein
VRNKQNLPPLTVDKILAWADAHFQRANEWPTQGSGPIIDSRGETWKSVQTALVQGLRGLPGGSTLARLLAENRGVRHHLMRPAFTLVRILSWADAHYERTGAWPNERSGPVIGEADETWKAIDRALQQGVRGLPGGSSLAKLLAEQRGKRNRLNRPRLTVDQILTWADAHYKLSGEWPTRYSGAVHGVDGETWSGINRALGRGSRELPAGTSLARLIEEHCGNPTS